ncbi:hypothetical protein RIF25_05690 [Thermosynechococcaceae cyanobacterium BACA0444]|uniref:Uncharacterized protein n=1 Tax=Pseudocalidococcus azoricus BACA0444 TaxID=2918990 RepID=A0AAE4JVF3_9CYAN|nr:hypothetical protein [Pseudocalidococcus azoricus]MDS3860295.1 hypothetical protein [Pseudocalidococcus azoricus BACA0444]
MMLPSPFSKVLETTKELPEAIQDELAKQLLEDIETEIKWQENFSKPQNA